MAYTTIKLPSEPQAAVAQLKAQSKDSPVFVFKFSPICPVSTMAETQFKRFLKAQSETASAFSIAWIDVIAEKPLARGLTAELDIAHQSPQALLFRDGDLEWNDSHGELTQDAFEELLAD